MIGKLPSSVPAYEKSHEDSRPHGTRTAQPTGIVAAKLADYRRNLSGRGVSGGYALSRHRAAADGIAAAGEIGAIRYHRGHFPARIARYGPRRRTQRPDAGRKPGPRRSGTHRN